MDDATFEPARNVKGAIVGRIANAMLLCCFVTTKVTVKMSVVTMNNVTFNTNTAHMKVSKYSNIGFCDRKIRKVKENTVVSKSAITHPTRWFKKSRFSFKLEKNC